MVIALTAYALRRSQEVVNFPEQLNELLSFFSRNFASDHPFRNIEVISGEPAIPELYMLGSSDGGLNFAVKEGLGLAFASYLSPQMTVPVLRAYKERFKPSVFMSVPRSIISAIVITAETDDEAKYLAAPLELLWARMYAGTLMQGQPFPSLEEAHSHVYSSAEKEARKENRNRFIIGGIKTVSDQLRNLASETMVDEVMLWEAYTDKVARHKAYKLLADEFKLSSTH
ncbi:LLM class flavin-dependent oxidoreductase [Paenibacillus kribbensis]|nr:LLM class flavin-dependent oxidoreductase [Paenibacillus kribbensis]